MCFFFLIRHISMKAYIDIFNPLEQCVHLVEFESCPFLSSLKSFKTSLLPTI